MVCRTGRTDGSAAKGLQTNDSFLALDRAHMRPHLIQFNRCGNVLLDGFKIRESPFWMIHLYHSENCVVRNLDAYAHGHNNDGVDVDMTKNVLIENCHFDQGDDGVVLKAGLPLARICRRDGARTS